MTIENKIFLDIETLPPTMGDHFDRIKANVQAPGNYKKPESIAEWMAANGDAVAREQFQRLALDGLYGEVCVVGFAIGDGAPAHVSSHGIGEEALLRSIFADIDAQATSGPSPYPHALVVVGHNVAEFDLRFLLQRAVRYELRVPAALRAAFDPDKGRYNVIDTMKLWGGFKGYVKLKDLTRELCGDTMDDIDGADVARVWESDPALVARHCMEDVKRVRDVYKRFASVLGLS